MSEMSNEELTATRLDNGSLKLNNLLDQWRLEYEIPLYEIDYIKDSYKRKEDLIKSIELFLEEEIDRITRKQELTIGDLQERLAYEKILQKLWKGEFKCI